MTPPPSSAIASPSMGTAAGSPGFSGVPPVLVGAGPRHRNLTCCSLPRHESQREAGLEVPEPSVLKPSQSTLDQTLRVPLAPLRDLDGITVTPYILPNFPLAFARIARHAQVMGARLLFPCVARVRVRF